MASDNYLKNIHSPADIKGMSYAQLNELAAEIRTVLIDTVSKNGGHLASNLGALSDWHLPKKCVCHSERSSRF